MRPLSEQTILITGSTDGHGRVLARELAAQGATVLVHGRSEARAKETIEEIDANSHDDRSGWYTADFASLAEVRELAERVGRHDHLDALVNNAGIGTTSEGDNSRQVSKDGYELRFAVNYLAGYVLTRLLQPLLQRSATARIVNVASVGQAAIDFDDPLLERGYDGGRAYRQSKLAEIMFTFDLADELQGTGVTATCLHPATYMATKLVHADGIDPRSSVEEGAQASLRLVGDPSLDGVTGRYFNGTVEADPHPQAHDPDARRQLRQLTERLTGLPAFD